MLRRIDICNIVNELSAESGSLDFDLKKAYNLIFDYCKKSQTRPHNNKYEMRNGCIFINGVIAGRVAPLPKKVPFNERAYYLEGRILARQEAYYNND